MVTPTGLYPLYCKLYLCTLTHQHQPAPVALSSAFVSDIFVLTIQCALHWLQLSKRLPLSISLRNLQTFYFVFLLEVGRSYHSTQFWTHLFLLPVFFCLLILRRSTLGWHPTQLPFFVSGYFNPACQFYFLRVTFQPTHLIFCFNPALILSVRLLLCPTMATNSYSSWDECP